jgi:UDP-N-acetylmuramoyl-L-alanyl-D-glutamate--2,6-diaminopimelate ligase
MQKPKSNQRRINNMWDRPEIAAKDLMDFDPQLFPTELFITGVSLNAQSVQPGDLYIALPGARNHGLDFLDIAIKNGAVAVLSDRVIACDIPIYQRENPRELVGALAAWFNDSPFKTLTAVAITGTNGKTTSANLVKQLWQLSGLTTGLIGTIGVEVAGRKFDAVRTTPEATDLQSIAALMLQNKVSHLSMEVSSHALVQGRASGAHFKVAAFTNLTQDHLDFHGDMESYYLAKAKLFTPQLSDYAIINIDDSYGRRLCSEIKGKFSTVSRDDAKADWHYLSYQPTTDGYKISIAHLGNEVIKCNFALLGDFNLDNLLIAVAIAAQTGLSMAQIEKAIPALKSVPGRLAKVNLGQDFNAIIDYAHTPDAVDRVLATSRSFTSGKVIALLGCGGDRDKSKRPLMGNSLLTGSDISIFTSDNPRGEAAESILSQMVGSNKVQTPSMIIADRKLAIKYAVSVAKAGDTILILGKGHESGQEIAGEVLPFDDQIELENAISELMSGRDLQ